MKSCIVSGAASQTGTWLVPALIGQGWFVELISRGVASRNDYGAQSRWRTFDLNGSVPPSCEASTLVHLADLWLILPSLPAFHKMGVRRVVAFSSTSRWTKTDSGNPKDKAFSDRLASAEAELAEICDRLGMNWTVLRPTITYGGKLGDRSVNTIARVIRRFGVFPLVGGGSGLRQPVHAADLAQAAIACLDNPNTFAKSFDVPGGERLSYRAMVERIFKALGKRPDLIPVPMAVFYMVIAVARLLPQYRYLTWGMAERMKQDMVFESELAREVFGYTPSGFIPFQEPLVTQQWSSGQSKETRSGLATTGSTA